MTPEEQNKRDEAAYKENCASARGLNAQMMQVPAFAMTLTGGLWFGAGLSDDVDVQVKSVLLFFVAIADFLFILVLFRLRNVHQSYLDKIKEFNPTAYATGGAKGILSKYSMVGLYAAILALAALASLAGAFWYRC